MADLIEIGRTATGIDFRMTGLDDLKRALEELGTDLRLKVVRAALRDAARLIATDAKARAPVLSRGTAFRTPGLVRRSIGVLISKDAKARGEIGVYVRVRRPRGAALRAFKRATGRDGGANPLDPFYWKFLEFGTKKMRARPFMLPAFNARATQAIDVFSRRIGERIEKANRRRGNA